MTTGLYVSIHFKPGLGGVEEHTDQISKHLTELGERITVLTPPKPGAAEFDRFCGYPVVRFETGLPTTGRLKSSLNRRLLLVGILKVAQRIKPDYLILSNWSPIVGPSVALASKLLKIPFFIFEHGLKFRQRFPYSLSRMITARAATRIICVSGYVRSLALQQSWVNPDRTIAILNGVNLSEVDAYLALREGPLDSEPPHPPTLLTVCGLGEGKGVDTVIKAMPSIVSQVPHAQYLIVGDGPDKKRLKRLVAASSARDFITFEGSLFGNDKFEKFEQCDVFIMPSRLQEGMPLVFPEAGAFGKPVIGGNCGGQSDAIIHGKTGFLVNPHDAYEVARTAIRLLKNPEYACELGKRGRQRVEKELNWEKSAAKLHSVIYAVLGNQSLQ